MELKDMEFNKFQQVFCDILPVMYKAAPLISSYIGSPITYVIVGLLAAITNCDATEPTAIANKLKSDPDLHTNLAKLESTHAQWLKDLQG